MTDQQFIFNLNSIIRVRIKEKGYQLLADSHNKYVGVIPNWDTRTPEYYKALADSEGYSEMTAWKFMSEFGPFTIMGMADYYDINIIIDAYTLTPL